MIEQSLPGPGIRIWTAWLIGVLLATADAAGEAADGAGQRRGAELATCAAYYFNASNARPLRDYEALYGSGETALNRARRILTAAEVDRLVGDASAAMSALTGGDWRNFVRVSEVYAANCDKLLGRDE